MGAVGGLLGLGGGAAGSGFSGPSNANVLNPSTTAQADQSYQNALQGLGNQSQFVNALTNNGGITNQANVYGQLQGVVNGTGPNPAQAQLAQSTGANTANQAALMAGQRGSNANAGLIARQAAMQGAANQQNSAGQAATLQANQSLNALNSAGSLATNQVNQAQQGLQGYTQAAQGEQQNVLNGIAGQNNANVGMQSNINNVNGQLANTTMQGQQALIGGLMNGGGASSIMSSLAEGGKVRNMYAEGGDADEGADAIPNTTTPSFGGDSGAAALSGKSSGGGGGAGLLALLAPGGKVVPMYANGVPSVPQASSYVNTNSNPNQLQPIPQIAPPGPNYPTGAVPAAIASPAVPAPADPYTAQPATPNKSGVKVSKPKEDKSVNWGNPGANALYQGVSSFGKYLSDKASSPSTKSPKGQYDASGFSADQLSTERARLDAQEAGGIPATDPLESNFGQANKTETLPTSNDNTMAEGGKVPAMVSPGERYLPPSEVAAVKEGKKNPMEAGEKIPGKPKVGGAKNSYANDTVPKDLDEGGLVLPRSVTQSKHPHWAAMKFVQAHMAQGGKVLPAKPKAKK